MIILYIIALLLSFIILAKVCDNYFVDSLDIIAKKWKMSSDAAGATLMAVGSSAPELFVALFSVIMPGEGNEAIGVGNIVGSAIFNILAITGAVGIVKASKLAWRPIIRDLVFYVISIGLLIWVFISGSFGYLETIIFLSFYTIYVIVVIKWKKMFPPTKSEIEITKYENSYKKTTEKKEEKWMQKIGKPIDFILKIIFPSQKYFYLVFIISIIIIAGISWVLVESAVHISDILHIPKAIVALTVLAVGTSVPDLISSVIVAKENRGGMAISNGIGSNIFDILVGLGFPFLIMIIISGKDVLAQAENLMPSSIVLFGTVILIFITFILNKWKIDKKIGIFFILIYLAYIVWQIILI